MDRSSLAWASCAVSSASPVPTHFSLFDRNWILRFISSIRRKTFGPWLLDTAPIWPPLPISDIRSSLASSKNAASKCSSVNNVRSSAPCLFSFGRAIRLSDRSSGSISVASPGCRNRNRKRRRRQLRRPSHQRRKDKRVRKEWFLTAFLDLRTQFSHVIQDLLRTTRTHDLTVVHVRHGVCVFEFLKSTTRRLDIGLLTLSLGPTYV